MKKIIIFLIVLSLLSLSSLAVTIDYNHYTIEYSKDKFVTTPDYKLGDYQFSSSELRFDSNLCTYLEEKLTLNDLDKSCFYVIATFAGNTYKIKGGDVVFLTPQISVQFEPIEGIFEWKVDPKTGTKKYTLKDEDTFKNNFIFDIDLSGFELHWIPEDTAVELTSREYVSFNIVQFVANNLEGGLTHKTTTEIIRTETLDENEIFFRSGSSVIQTPLKTDILGKVDMLTKAHVYLYGSSVVDSSEPTSNACRSYNGRFLCLQKEKYMAADKVEAGYLVVPKGFDFFTSVKCVYDRDCPEGFGCRAVKHEGEEFGICTFAPKKDYSLFYFLGFLFVIKTIAIGVGIYLYKKRKFFRKNGSR